MFVFFPLYLSNAEYKYISLAYVIIPHLEYSVLCNKLDKNIRWNSVVNTPDVLVQSKYIPHGLILMYWHCFPLSFIQTNTHFYK